MFKFPLQRLLDLKAKREQEMARQLAMAQAEAERERTTRDSLAQLHAAAHSTLAAATGGAVTVGHVMSLAQTLVPLHDRVAHADERTAAAEQVVDRRHELLSSASQERQVLDRLREKRFDLHRVEENARDLQAMDAIALTRFSTPSSNPSNGHEG